VESGLAALAGLVSREARGEPHSWSGKKVFVTGATGLIGAEVVAQLIREGAIVSVLIRDADRRSQLLRSGDVDRVAVFSGALEDLAGLERALAESESSVVLHLAAQTLVGVGQAAPLLTFEANIRGTYHLLEACRRQAARIEAVVIASSDKAYGESGQLPYTEDLPLRGEAPYEASKSAADLVARAYYATYGLPIAIARCGNTYGAGDLNWSRIVPGTIRAYLEGKPPEIRSDGSYRRDYVYVRDIAEAYLGLASQLGRADVRGEAFNFATSTPMTVLEIVQKIRSLIGGRLPDPRILNTARHEIRDQYLSAMKAQQVLGWKARYSLDEGLRETIDWYRSYLGATV
jgi:CDP-glucose 4,6-dehydratase